MRRNASEGGASASATTGHRAKRLSVTDGNEQISDLSAQRKKGQIAQIDWYNWGLSAPQA